GSSPSHSNIRRTLRILVDRTTKDTTHLKSRKCSNDKSSDKLRSTEKVEAFSTNGARVEENINNSNKYQ
ncbi:hypothetical protein RYX36_008039, partial [Vicia faba]